MQQERLIFIEFGLGNSTIISTEIEKECGHEYRIKGACPLNRIRGIYLRLWIFKSVYIISTFDGFSKTIKPRNNFKILIGISGYR